MSWPITIYSFSSQSEGDLEDDLLHSVHTADKGDAHVLRMSATGRGDTGLHSQGQPFIHWISVS